MNKVLTLFCHHPEETDQSESRYRSFNPSAIAYVEDGPGFVTIVLVTGKSFVADLNHELLGNDYVHHSHDSVKELTRWAGSGVYASTAL